MFNQIFKNIINNNKTKFKRLLDTLVAVKIKFMLSTRIYINYLFLYSTKRVAVGN